MEISDISEKIKEAETYRSMGLLEESIHIYEEILSTGSAIEEERRLHIQSTVDKIKEELEDLEIIEENTVSEAELALIRENLLTVDDVPGILESASAYMEMGLFKNALAEYEKLFTDKGAWKDVVEEIAACLLKYCGPSEILQTVKKVVGNTRIKGPDKADIQFRLALEMQKRDLNEVAQELCSSAREHDPGNEEIQNWLDSNSFQQEHLDDPDLFIELEVAVYFTRKKKGKRESVEETAEK